jgi:hypothetical protein
MRLAPRARRDHQIFTLDVRLWVLLHGPAEQAAAQQKQQLLLQTPKNALAQAL